MRVAIAFLLTLASSTLQAQTQTFFQGTVGNESFTRNGTRTTPLGTSTVTGETVIIDNGFSRSRQQIGPYGYTVNSDGTIIYTDGSIQREQTRNGPLGTANVNNTYTQNGSGLVIDGTRETATGNTITSNGTIIYDDGSLNRDVTRTGSNGNSVTANGTVTQTGQGWTRDLNRQYPNSFSNVQSEVIRGNQEFNRSTNRNLANGQFVQGSGTITYGNGQFNGARSALSTSGRGFSGQSTASRFNGGYTRSGSRSTNFGTSRGVRRGRRGR